MKKWIFFSFALIVMEVSGSWVQFGPEGIQANRVRFQVYDGPDWAICHDGGFCLYDPGSQTWTDYPSALPVIDACYLDGEGILVIMGNGTDSDGIYRFNTLSGEFELILFVDSPFFIHYSESSHTYYVGHYMELLQSADGYSWTPVDTFINRTVVAMDSYENHVVVSEMDNLYGIWYSDDDGTTWTLSPYSPEINSLGFDPDGKLYGTFPDNSWSSGLWSSTDYGATWDVEFWSVGLNCVGFDFDHVFAGWGEEAYPPDEGVAWFHPETGSLTFLNDGLPNLLINQITYNPGMSAIALFCCTENGAYVSCDYYLGIPDITDPATLSDVVVFPDPGSSSVRLEYNLARTAKVSGQLVSASGSILWCSEPDRQSPGIHTTDLDIRYLASGIYFIQLQAGDQEVVRRVVKL